MECARRAGHTIAVLFRVYAKVLAQTQERANHRIDAALREWNERGEGATCPPGDRWGTRADQRRDSGEMR